VTGRAPLVVVAGLGSEYRRDDGAGPLVAARAVEEAGTGRDVGPITDPLDLLGVWDGADLAVVVDAVQSGAAPGTVYVVELGGVGGVPYGPSATTSTHGIGLAGVVRLSRAVGAAPDRVVVVGIEGEDFGRGTGLSPAVEAALAGAVGRVVDLIGEVRTCV